MKERRAGNVSTRHKGVGVSGSALLRHELARDGARGFRSGIGCSGMILMTQDGRRQVGIGRTGVGTVMVMTVANISQFVDRPEHYRRVSRFEHTCHSLSHNFEAGPFSDMSYGRRSESR